MSRFGQRIEPFRGLHYNRDKCRDLAAMVAPPYDLIGAERQRQLYERSPFNVVRLELNREPEPYQAAAAMLKEWLEQGICQRARRAAIYLYTQIFALEGRKFRREGLVARVRLEEFSQGRIAPHERTFAAAKEDRMRLLSATRTNLSSIFGLYPRRAAELDELLEAVAVREPMLELSDDLEILNQLRAIDDAREVAVIQRALSEPRLLIADGHHRYETALNYRRQRRASEGDPARLQPYDYTMMTLVACDDPGLKILPTHRVVRELGSDVATRFAERAAENFEVRAFSERGALRAALERAGRGAIGMALRGDPELRLLRLRDGAAMAKAMPSAPDAVRELDVSILHSLVLERLLGLDDAAVKRGDNLEYTIDANTALGAVAQGRVAAAFIVNPPSIEEVQRVCDAGATMPEKSTYFYPKLLTGLVMNPLDD